MRINDTYAGARKSESINYKPKAFILSEGNRTEPRYFDSLNKSVLSENVAIINILRDYASRDNSNPTFITEILSDFLDTSENKIITVKELKNKISNWHHENMNKFDLNRVLNNLNAIYKNDKDVIKYEDSKDLFISLFKEEIREDLIKNFSEYFEAQDIVYDPDVDSLNMVIDRDRESFTANQYDKVCEFCKEHKINLYVSNPCFEFWLLLHFDEVDNMDKEELYSNKKVDSNSRYLEKNLKNICGYKKDYFPFTRFEPNIQKAIEREKNYAEDLEKLKDNLGSNVGLLVEKLIKK